MKMSPLPVATLTDSRLGTFGDEKLVNLLKRYFGYSDFRGKQLEAIKASLSGRDCFCLMPTGGGKSLCFQIPALAKTGIVLVICPLIALMENQVAALKEKEIPAEYLSSTQLAHIKERIYDDLESGRPALKLLYVTPELVTTSRFMSKLTKLNARGILTLIAIDEAHCISTWGHDFRPSYRKLSYLRNQLKDVPILALTATAVPKVQKDVINSLSLHDPLILKASFNRPNIFYEVRYKDLLNDSYGDLLKLLKSSEGSCSIVYCLERTTCDELATHLLKGGISCAAYHAGLNNKLRSSILNDWIFSKIQVVVATVAFGMGIDRKDVRIVCHFNIPKSMESFYQESGRAGRDQLPSRSVLYYGMEDRRRMEYILSNAGNKKSQSSSSQDGLSKKSVADFNQMVDYCEGYGCRRKKILESFGEQVPASCCCKTCDACKNPYLIAKYLGNLAQVSSTRRSSELCPVFINSSFCMEMAGHDDEANFSEDISDSDDGSEVIRSLGKSQLNSKSGLMEKLECLQRAEESYYERVPKERPCNPLGKKIVTDSQRQAGKVRLLHALKQSEQRLGDAKVNLEASAIALEDECFEKYGKVGKTFYNSQVASTIRWLSSSTYADLHKRLGLNLVGGNACTQSNMETLVPGKSKDQDLQPLEKASEESTNVVAQLETSSQPVSIIQSEIPSEHAMLPPIMSFSEFVSKQKRNELNFLRNPTNKHLSLKLPENTGYIGTGNTEKRMKLQ